jgi:hypothetical protein
MSEENAISKILYLAGGNVNTSNLLKNGGFEAGSLSGWESNGASIITSPVLVDRYSANLDPGVYIYQYTEPLKASEVILSFWAQSISESGSQTLIGAGFKLSDETTDTLNDITVSGSAWTFYEYRGTSSLDIKFIMIYASIANTAPIYIDEVHCTRVVQQVTLVPESTFKSVPIAVTSTANSLSSVITGVANKHLKIYSIVYNSSGSGTQWMAWYSSGSGLDYSMLSGEMPFDRNEGYTISVNPPSILFKTAVTGSTLYLSSSAAAKHGGFISYWDDDST